MNIEQLLKKLEPKIREIVRDELKKNKQEDWSETMKKAKDAMSLLQGISSLGNKKKKEYDGEDFEI